MAIDRTTTIRASLHDVEQTLVIAVLLVVLVVFVFLRNWRATLIPAVAVPVSLIGTFSAMYLFGFSLDNLSLMALTVATGFVVDDAVVVLENISRHMEAGMSRMQRFCSVRARSSFTVLSMTHLADARFSFRFCSWADCSRALLPRVLDHDVGGDRGFAAGVADYNADDVLQVAAPSSRRTQDLVGKFFDASERAFNLACSSGYERTLSWALSAPLLMMFILLATVCLNVYLCIELYRRDFSRPKIPACWRAVCRLIRASRSS